MQPFFNTVEKILKLEQICESWRGTPFMPNAAIKGAGVSCQKLVGAILIETGALPTSFVIPEGPMNWSAAHKDSLIDQFMSQQTAYFAAFDFDLHQKPLPGDMVGFKISGCIHHCGIVFRGDGSFVHCLRPQGVQFNNLQDASYWSRLVKFWRPIVN